MFDQQTLAILHKYLAAFPTIIGEKSLKHDVDELIKQLLPATTLCVVDDVNTSDAFGKHVARALACQELKLAAGIAANEDSINYIRKHTAKADALIAVGSGTISDLCKYASHLDGKPYVAIPTAASMNGYTSANASIGFFGYKKTVTAHMPLAVLCDLSVIAIAPARLSKAGFGDALARATAQSDWLLSHLLLGSDYLDAPFALIAPYEPQLFEDARGIAKSDPASIALLLKISLLSGLGMTIAGGSYPASQGEHMIAHAYGMLTKTEHLHGEAIGATTLTMARMQENILQNGGRLRADDFNAEKIITLFGRKIATEAQEAFKKKMDACLRCNDKIDWDKVREHINPIFIAPARLESLLVSIGAPIQPEALGWDINDYKTTIEYARYLRDRFTFLDVQ